MSVALLLAGLGTFGGVWAVDGVGTLDLGTGLLVYGPLGIMVAGFMFGYIVPGPTHKRVVDENDRLRLLIDEKVWPTINDATAAMRDSTDTVREVVRMLPAEEPYRPSRAPRGE